MAGSPSAAKAAIGRASRPVVTSPAMPITGSLMVVFMGGVLSSDLAVERHTARGT